MKIDDLAILYVGPAHRGTCMSRLKALQALVRDVRVVNPAEFLSKFPSPVAWLETTLCWGPATIRFNRGIIQAVQEQAVDWVWVDKGVLVFPRTILSLRERGLFLIHHCTDDILNPMHKMHYYKKVLGDYHVHLTSNIYNVQELKQLGAPFVIQTHLGFDPDFCNPGGRLPAPQHEYRADVVFVGHWREHIDRFVIPLLENDVDVKLWGQGWNKSFLWKWYRRQVMPTFVSNEDYPVILASAKIALCFLSRANRNTSTGRSFEIPAVGALMLAERTNEHLSFYVEGEEADFFDTPEELLQKVRYYLAHEGARRRVAQAGYLRATRSGYSYLDRMRADIPLVFEIYRNSNMRRNPMPKLAPP